MAFDWGHFLTLAEELVSRPPLGRSETVLPDSAYQRAAIGRAYYALFCIARDLLIDETALEPSRESHDGVWKLFLNDGLRQRREIGTIGDRLKRRRHRADYLPTYPNLAEETENTLSEARRAQRMIAALERR